MPFTNRAATTRRPSRDEIHRAFSRRCSINCPTCRQRCRVDHSYNHRSDCCGEVTVHILSANRQGELPAHRVANPNQAAYICDPVSRTTRPAEAPEPLPFGDQQA
jgi:hypothetical protein